MYQHTVRNRPLSTLKGIGVVALLLAAVMVDSLLGRLLAPILGPLGFADWRVATSLVTGFTAKEAVVSTMAVLLGTNMNNLGAALSGMFTPLSGASFLLFTLLYTPCVAAVATIKRELGSRLATIGVVLMQCGVAWLVACLVYQIGSLVL